MQRHSLPIRLHRHRVWRRNQRRGSFWRTLNDEGAAPSGRRIWRRVVAIGAEGYQRARAVLFTLFLGEKPLHLVAAECGCALLAKKKRLAGQDVLVLRTNGLSFGWRFQCSELRIHLDDVGSGSRRPFATSPTLRRDGRCRARCR